MFKGVVDLVSVKKIIWSDKEILVSDLNDKDNNYTSVLEKRNHLIDQLSSLDNDLADSILQTGCFESVSVKELLLSVRKVTISKVRSSLLSYKYFGIYMIQERGRRACAIVTTLGKLHSGKVLGLGMKGVIGECHICIDWSFFLHSAIDA